MVYLSHIIRPDILQDSLDQGLIRYQHHPTLPYVIYNYTERAQWAGIWNEATRQCRGLVVNTLTNQVVARPFPKFFNYGERWVDMGPNEPVVSTDKLDGSLGILYPDVDGYSVATRGSFSSDQARHATEIWKKRYEEITDVPEDLTLLFEIIYPENRIVVDYGDIDDLILLGGVRITTGRNIDPYQIEWPGPVVGRMEYKTLADALEAPDRPGAEGMVVWCPYSDERVKIKQEDYVQLHRIVTGLNEKRVLEHLSSGMTSEELFEQIPEEFHEWISKTVNNLEDLFIDFSVQVVSETEKLQEIGLFDPDDRKSTALAIQEYPAWLKAAVFAALDGRNYDDVIWKKVKESMSEDEKCAG